MEFLTTIPPLLIDKDPNLGLKEACLTTTWFKEIDDFSWLSLSNNIPISTERLENILVSMLPAINFGTADHINNFVQAYNIYYKISSEWSLFGSKLSQAASSQYKSRLFSYNFAWVPPVKLDSVAIMPSKELSEWRGNVRGMAAYHGHDWRGILPDNYVLHPHSISDFTKFGVRLPHHSQTNEDGRTVLFNSIYDYGWDVGNQHHELEVTTISEALADAQDTSLSSKLMILLNSLGKMSPLDKDGKSIITTYGEPHHKYLVSIIAQKLSKSSLAKVVVVEGHIYLELNSAYLTGHVDVSVGEDGKIEVVDFKPDLHHYFTPKSGFGSSAHMLTAAAQVSFYAKFIEAMLDFKYETKCTILNGQAKISFHHSVVDAMTKWHTINKGFVKVGNTIKPTKALIYINYLNMYVDEYLLGKSLYYANGQSYATRSDYEASISINRWRNLDDTFNP